jgi:NADH-quinone oxidoreductase subunit G
MPTVIVDGIEVLLGEKERLNGIQVAARAGAEIPHYCWHAGLSVVASCRMCLVEAGKKGRQDRRWRSAQVGSSHPVPAEHGVHHEQ